MTLNGENAAYDPKLLLWKPGEALDILVVENRSYPNLVHRRAVLFVDKSYFVILDEALGEGIGEVDIHFQLAPGDVNFSWENLTAQTLFEEGWNVLIQGQMQKDLLMEEEDGQVSFEYTQKESRPAFRYQMLKTKEKGVRFVTLVAPFEETPPNLNIQVVGNPTIGSQEIILEIENNGIKKQIGYEIKPRVEVKN
jgi:heparan-sulfate lyase